MLVAADYLQENGTAEEQDMGELLRLYVDIQTYVRTSMPIPLSMGERYNELQNKFNTKETRSIESDSEWYGAKYYKPLGVYYLGLQVSLNHLDNNPNLLSTEPIRELEVRYCYAGEALARLLRNYRMGYIQRLTLRFDSRTRRPGNVKDVAIAVNSMLGEMMETVMISGIDDRAKAVQVMFACAKKVRKGCRLNICIRSYSNTPDYSVVKK